MPSHSEIRRLPYTAAQMYALVADVERYPEFLPWNSAARIRARRPQPDGSEVLEADLVISFKLFRERFGSRVTLFPEERRILTEYLDGPFRYLRSGWDFTDLPGTTSPLGVATPGSPAPGPGAPGPESPGSPASAEAIPARAALSAAPGCSVDFHVDFEFRNIVLQKVIGVVFDEAMRRIVRAFESRAEALYGAR